MNFHNDMAKWDKAEVPVKSMAVETAMHVEDPKEVKDSVNQIKTTLDVQCKPANLDKIAKECAHLDEKEHKLLQNLLEKHETLFHGALSHWKNEEHDIELKKDVQPFHA